VRVARPLRFTFHITGPDIEGYVAPKQPANIRFYSAGLDQSARWCGVVPLSPPVGLDGKRPLVPYSLGTRRGEIRAGTLVNARVPLDFKGRPALDVKLVSPTRIELAAGRFVSVQVGQISIARC
jgi:hypothetical protein